MDDPKKKLLPYNPLLKSDMGYASEGKEEFSLEQNTEVKSGTDHLTLDARLYHFLDCPLPLEHALEVGAQAFDCTAEMVAESLDRLVQSGKIWFSGGMVIPGADYAPWSAEISCDPQTNKFQVVVGSRDIPDLDVLTAYDMLVRVGGLPSAEAERALTRAASFPGMPLSVSGLMEKFTEEEEATTQPQEQTPISLDDKKWYKAEELAQAKYGMPIGSLLDHQQLEIFQQAEDSVLKSFASAPPPAPGEIPKPDPEVAPSGWERIENPDGTTKWRSKDNPDTKLDRPPEGTV